MEDNPKMIEFSTVEETPSSQAPNTIQRPNKSIKLSLVFFASILGILTAVLLTKNYTTSSNQTPKLIQSDNIVGSTAKNFKDSAEGILEKNDSKIVTEGSHRLVRDGESQTVYLTSSVVDLDNYIGKKVKVWGETFNSKKAGWLMDVGKVEIN